MRAPLLLSFLSLFFSVPVCAQNWFHAPFAMNGAGYSHGFGDIDGDGDVDAVSAAGPWLRALLNDGRGVFEPGAETLIGGDGSAATLDGVLADVNGDGFLDVVGRREYLVADAFGLLVYFWDPVQAMFLPPAVHDMPNALGSFVAADIDGDGAAEIGITWGSVFSSTSVAWVDWTGGGFVQSASVQLDVGHAGLVAADFTDDAVPDLVTVSFLGPAVALVLPTVAGAPTLGATAVVPAVGLRTVYAGDREGDGDVDLLVASGDLEETVLSLVWVENLGTGAIQAGTPTNLGALTHYELATGDWDGDGDADVAGPGVLIENVGAGLFAGEVTQPLTDEPLAVADFNGDAKADLATWDRLLFGVGGFDLPVNQGLAVGVELAVDWEGDGDLDLFETDNPVEARVWLQDGTASFEQLVLPYVGLETNRFPRGSMGPADLDGDGHLDLLREVVEQANPFQVPVFVRMGLFVLAGGTALVEAGAATAGAEIELSLQYEENLAVDLDLDGDLDVLAGDTLWINDGSGFFSAPNELFDGAVKDAADVDADGDVDLLARLDLPSGDFDLALLRDQGGAYATEVLGPGLFGRGSRLVDVDGDGDRDALFFEDTSPSDLILTARNQGASFAPAELVGEVEPGFVVSSLAVGDVDGDGRSDVLCYYHDWSQQERLTSAFLRLPGAGFAFDAPLRWHTGGVVAVADLDRDGDPDLAGTLVYRNDVVSGPGAPVVRQYGDGAGGSGGWTPVLGALGTPEVGATVTVRLSEAVGGAPGFLGVGSQEAALVDFPLPGLVGHVGNLSALLPIATGGTPGQPGAGTFELAFVPQSGLVGKSVFSQVLLVDPAGPSGFTATNGLELHFAP